MGDINVHLSSSEAELMLYALALRYKQAEKLNRGVNLSEIKHLARKIEGAGETAGWSKTTNGWTRFEHWLYPMKTVTVKFYEKNPNPIPPGVKI